MKRAVKFIGIYIIIGLISYGIFRLSDKYQLSIIRNNIECSVLTKGCEGAISLTCNNGSNIYIAFPKYIKEINAEGKEKIVYKSDGDIEDVECNGENLYIISGNNLVKYNLVNNEKVVLFDNIPLGGREIKRSLMVYGDNILITISASTNSGLNDDGSAEYTPIRTTNPIGNASIYQVNLKSNKMTLFASGIRGITGMDYNNKNDLYAIFTGMKNEGIRPVNRDFDYIYKVKKGNWYGWPDFSGGDYITSPRFAGEKLVTPILKKPRTKTVEGPFFVDDSLGAMNNLAVDRNGAILPKDSLVFWNKKKQMIEGLIDGKAIFDVIKLVDKSDIKEMKYSNDQLLILDSGVGCIFSVHKKIGMSKFQLPTIIWVFLGLLFFGIVTIVGTKFYRHN